MKNYKNRNWLYIKYWLVKLSIPKIAELDNCSQETIFRWLKKFNIRIRTRIEARKLLPNNGGTLKKGHVPWNKGKKGVYSKESREKMSEAQLGEKNNRWKGGRKINMGYVYILKPDHPRASWDGYVAEHQLVMEKILDRYLKKGEIPHHKNEIKDDNRPENLEIRSYSEHTLIHMKVGLINQAPTINER